jgi:hypothetical protein
MRPATVSHAGLLDFTGGVVPLEAHEDIKGSGLWEFRASPEVCAMPPMKPVRRDGIVVRELADEVLVYDLVTHRAHCLNAVAGHVFKRCDGRTSMSAIARSLHEELGAPVDEAWVGLALDQLREAGLLRSPDSPGTAGGWSRREMVAKAGLGMAILLPAVVSILAPTPAEAAATCVKDCTGQPFGTPCSSTAPSNCLCSCDGVGGCSGGC